MKNIFTFIIMIFFIMNIFIFNIIAYDDGIGGDISPEMAKAYLNIIQQHCKGNIGTTTVLEKGSFEEKSVKFNGEGLFNAKLIDFDNDGVKELIFAESESLTPLGESSESGDYGIFYVSIYGFNGKNAIKIIDDFKVVLYLDGFSQIELHKEGEKTYVVDKLDYYMQSNTKVYEIKNNKFQIKASTQRIHEIETGKYTYNIFSNEEYIKTTESEYTSYINNYINKYNQNNEIFWGESVVEKVNPKSFIDTLRKIAVSKYSDSDLFENDKSSNKGIDVSNSIVFVLVNGELTKIPVYNINESNYFHIRDIAYVLNGSSKQFNVNWNSKTNSINIFTGQSYKEIGDELQPKGRSNEIAVSSNVPIYIDGKKINFSAYNIDGNNYFKLRDISQYIGFNVDWNKQTDTIGIYSEDWKTIYSNLLSDNSTWITKNTDYYDYEHSNFPEGITFGLQDITNDNIPELLLQFDESWAMANMRLYIISYNNKSLDICEVNTNHGGYGGYDISKDVIRIVGTTLGVNWEYIYKLKNNTIEEIEYISSKYIGKLEAINNDTIKYSINYKEVSKNEYDLARSKYNFKTCNFYEINNLNINKYILN